MTRGQRLGDWKFVCALSGFTGWASDSVLTWDGKRVLRRFVGSEASRHPQDIPLTVRDDPSVPWSRPPGTDTFRSPVAVRPSDL